MPTKRQGTRKTKSFRSKKFHKRTQSTKRKRTQSIKRKRTQSVRRNRRNVKNDKIIVKRKLFNALHSLRRMKTKDQRLRTRMASSEFIKDIANVMRRIRTRPELVKSTRHRKVLTKHKKLLQKIVSKKSSPEQQRKLLLQKRGGFIQFLIPILCAVIGAGGSIGAAAVGAKVMKS